VNKYFLYQVSARRILFGSLFAITGSFLTVPTAEAERASEQTRGSAYASLTNEKAREPMQAAGYFIWTSR